MVRTRFELKTFRWADRRSSNWANRASGCNFVLKALYREEPGTRIWLKLMSKLLPKIAIFQKNQYIICSFAPLQKSPLFVGINRSLVHYVFGPAQKLSGVNIA